MSANDLDRMELMARTDADRISGFTLDETDLADIDARMPLAQPDYADPVTGFEPTEDSIRMPDMAAIREDLADAVYASSLNTIYVTDAMIDASVVAEVNN